MIRKKSFSLIATLILVIAGGFFVAHSAQALTLIPPSFETSVDPGVTLDTQVKLFNETQETLQLYPEVVSFGALGEDGVPSYDFTSAGVGVSTWFTLPDGPIILEPNDREVVPVQITPPADAEPGGHYATVFFGTEPPESDQGGSVSLGTKLGSLFLLRVFGDVVEDGNIVSFQPTDGGTSFPRLPVTFETRFQNTGNIHLRPIGTITVTNLFGQESAALAFNENRSATLPDSIRRYDTVWEKAQVEEANGNAWSNFWTEFRNEKNNFALGRYTASLALTAGSGDLISDTASVTFWVWPWRMMTVGGLVIVLLIILLVFLIKRYNQWIVRRTTTMMPPHDNTPGATPGKSG